ncbi:MAG: hypothetical protein K6E77_00190 [Lachnospiraceae bacterium]|nr:hypothetical protein [Lachnospiraceae bacterium]
MAIGMIEMQGSIPRVQDYQMMQQFENDKGVLYQAQHQLQVDKQVEQDNNQVHKKEDSNAETDANEKENGGSYAGDGGRNRRNAEKKLPDRVVVKGREGFDIKV